MASLSKLPERQYLIRQAGEVQGPFEARFIEAMVFAGVFSPSAMVQEKGGASWSPLSEMGFAPGGSDVPATALVPPPTERVGKPPKRKAKKHSKTELGAAWIGGIVGVFVLVWMVSTISPSQKRSVAGPRTSPPPKTAPPASSAPKPRPSVSYSNPAPKPPPVSGQLLRDASGQTYRVPTSAYHRLMLMRSALNLKNDKVTQRQNELDALERKLERTRIYLDRTSEYAVNSFNADVNRFNTMNDAAQSLIDDYNRDVNAFNAELERIGTIIR